jgi:hypothetical protein
MNESQLKVVYARKAQGVDVSLMGSEYENKDEICQERRLSFCLGEIWQWQATERKGQS